MKSMLQKLIISLFIFSYVFVSAQSKLTNDTKINSLIEKKRAYNKHRKPKYRIQLYYGNEKKAQSYEARFRSSFSGVNCKRSYDNPYWKVKIGSYNEKIDAERFLNKIREKFPAAIIVKNE